MAKLAFATQRRLIVLVLEVRVVVPGAGDEIPDHACIDEPSEAVCRVTGRLVVRTVRRLVRVDEAAGGVHAKLDVRDEHELKRGTQTARCRRTRAVVGLVVLVLVLRSCFDLQPADVQDSYRTPAEGVGAALAAVLRLQLDAK